MASRSHSLDQQSASAHGRKPKRLNFQLFNNGLYSELNNMMLAVLYCAMHGIEFRLSSAFSTNFRHNGWTDFFEPFCDEISDRTLHLLDFRSLKSDSFAKATLKRIADLYLNIVVKPLRIPGEYTTADLWESIRNVRNSEKVQFSFKGSEYTLSVREALHLIHSQIWSFNAEMQHRLQSMLSMLSLPEHYAAMHIRRGDKGIEAALEHESLYITVLREHSSLRDVYVMTDDSDVLQTLRRCYPNFRFYNHGSLKQGYVNRDFHRLSPDIRGELIANLLCENEVMRRADLFVGTFSSNIGVYQGIARDAASYGVDRTDWIFW